VGILTVDLHLVNEVYFAFTTSFCEQYFSIFLKKLLEYLACWNDEVGNFYLKN